MAVIKRWEPYKVISIYTVLKTLKTPNGTSADDVLIYIAYPTL